MTPRVRFAPSPTGHVHIGNMRAAIFNWLFARHEGGQFLLRIEDTDRERSTPEAIRAVLDAIDWLGLHPDGEPVYQSQRREAHLAAAEQLLRSGRAYKLDKGGTGKGEAILFKMPGRDIAFHDAVKGPMKKAAADMPDFVIVRSDGQPVFHLANVVDDIEMGITHIIRGDDHVENTFRHIALFEALGAPVPTYAHLPMIVNAQGKPYSKRDGAAFVGEFRENGYEADALFNYLALLGWNPGDEREIMSREELIASFTLERVQSKPAQFDFKKFEWMNGEYLKRMPPSAYRERFRKELEAHGLWDPSVTEDYLDRVCALLRERVKRWADVPLQAGYFFTEQYPFDADAVRKRLQKEGARDHLVALREAFAALSDFGSASIERALRETAERRGVPASDLIHPLRVAVTGLAGGPGLFELLEVLGRDRVLARLDRSPPT
ncbi:MAG: glutamate--tRNA ligase [Kiritimatiellae bacterium]|nr:glutamate--tRNA ligase [Kiritimatiellia bacterium]MDW8457533.1 glutamate--tRNA ligase [Verrucomicrobiota bacterium]